MVFYSWGKLVKLVVMGKCMVCAGVGTPRAASPTEHVSLYVDVFVMIQVFRLIDT